MQIYVFTWNTLYVTRDAELGSKPLAITFISHSNHNKVIK